ncbi:MAG: carboxypeptidase-like regulatory domain-containing protein [Cyclobacteriaceae bacterium]|nr:carboxypeptidase-like regulatory domain-containing protein [Cyclobacteriaceae bacterium]
MKRILPFTFLFFSFCLHAQQIFLRGKITDAETGEGISFAHVGICGKSIGTVANDLGIFEFRIPAGSVADTVCASAIGYETFQIAIPEIKGDKAQFAILLKPYTNELSEIVIKDERVTARRIIAKAISRIPKNYPRKAFELEGYYRDYIRKNDEYVSFLEGVNDVSRPWLSVSPLINPI